MSDEPAIDFSAAVPLAVAELIDRYRAGETTDTAAP
jgi:hypothetical protein